jgi:TonB family protein
VAGVAVNLLLLLIGMCRLPRLGSAHSDVHAEIAASVNRVSAMFGVRRRLVLVCSRGDAAILTWGVLRPRLVLPARAAQWPRDRLDIVLAHEIAHIARADWLVQIVAQVCRAIYWFNPLFWVACAHLRHESERACDDAVVNTGVTSHAYAAELVELARSGGRHRKWLPASAITPRASNLERRVRAMLNAGVDRDPVTPRGRWASAFALLAVTLPIATFAQGGFATFSGTIVDPQDRLLPAVTITVTDASRGVKHETKSDRNGRFELVGLPAGDYAVGATSLGFRNLSDTFTLDGQTLERTFKLQVAELQETVTVISDDGSVTSARQSGNAGVKRSNQVCGSASTNDVGGTLRPPHKVKDVRPGYPGVSGDVQLAATISADGSVTDVQVVKADRPELAGPAIDAVRQWEFDSTLLNCVPIEVQMNVNVSFRQNR